MKFDAMIRLETLSLMSDVSLPIYVARAQLASAVQVVVQIARFPDGTRRLQTISEMLALSADQNYQFQDLFQFQASGRDAPGALMKFSVPVVADGRVFVAGGGYLAVYGLFSQTVTQPAAPTGAARRD